MIFKSVFLSEEKIYNFTIHTMRNTCSFEETMQKKSYKILFYLRTTA